MPETLSNWFKRGCLRRLQGSFHKKNIKKMGRKAKQGVEAIVPVIGAVPIAGTPLKGAIEALLRILNLIEKRNTNKEKVGDLIERLKRLNESMDAIPTSSIVVEQKRRSQLTIGLDDILSKLRRLHVSSILDSEAVENVIAECNAKIDEYLKDYEVVAIMDLSNKVENIKFVLTNIENRLPQQMKFDYVFVMDATGREYRMLPEQCSSPQKFIRFFKASLGHEDKDAVVLHYLNRNEYDFFIDGNSELMLLDWSKFRIQGGARVIMTAILTQRMASFRRGYKCPRCRTNNFSKNPEDFQLTRFWITCWNCVGRFLITEERSHHKEGPGESFFGLRVRNDLLLNIHIKGKECHVDSNNRENRIGMNVAPKTPNVPYMRTIPLPLVEDDKYYYYHFTKIGKN